MTLDQLRHALEGLAELGKGGQTVVARDPEVVFHHQSEVDRVRPGRHFGTGEDCIVIDLFSGE